jgi:hypothetical protein
MWVGRRAIRVLDLLSLLLVHTSQARLVNISIDDTNGDLTTGQKPVYQPSNAVWFRPPCSYCHFLPNTSLAFDRTWTAVNYDDTFNNNINITFSFTG